MGVVGSTRRRRSCRPERRGLAVGEDAAAGEEADALGRLEREAGAAAGHHVHDQLGVAPALELGGADVEWAAPDGAEPDVGGPGAEPAYREAHRRAAVAAAARLVEQELAVQRP